MELEQAVKIGSRARFIRTMLCFFWAILQVSKFALPEGMITGKVRLVHVASPEGFRTCKKFGFVNIFGKKDKCRSKAIYFYSSNAGVVGLSSARQSAVPASVGEHLAGTLLKRKEGKAGAPLAGSR